MKRKHLVIAISGASGAIYAHQLLGALSNSPHEVSIVISDNARQIWRNEVPLALESHKRKIYSNSDFSAPFASGSNAGDAVIIIPCSMGMIGKISQGIASDLISRAADVSLKEKRQLIVVPRETPYNRIQLQNMLRLTEAGATIMPASPSFYGKAQTIVELIDTVVARIMDHLKIPYSPATKRWGE